MRVLPSLEIEVYWCGEIAANLRSRALPAEEAHVWHRPPDPAEASRWTLYDLPVKAGYAAALAMSVVDERGDAQD